MALACTIQAQAQQKVLMQQAKKTPLLAIATQGWQQQNSGEAETGQWICQLSL